MYNWGTSLNRKKHQRKINKVIRGLNKSIIEDDMWRGRFEAKQIHTDFYVFDDKSGAFIISYIEMVDKKTHKAALIYIEESQYFDSHLSWAMNNFIVSQVEAEIEKSEIDSRKKKYLWNDSYIISYYGHAGKTK